MTLKFCAGCGKALRGRYLEAMDAAWHADCFRCSGCGEPIGGQSFAVCDKRAYHRECYEARFAPRCGGCGQALRGEFLRALGRTWHHGCLVCAGCNKPFGPSSFVEEEGRPYHLNCHRQRFGLRCGYCGSLLEKSYRQSAWGENFCPHHADQWPSCFTCSRPTGGFVTGPGKRFNDGKVQCRLCGLDAVHRKGEGKRLFEGVLQNVKQFGIDFGKKSMRFRFADGLSINEGDASCNMLGRTIKEWREVAGHIRHRRISDILIRYSLPRPLFQAVAAHELAHAWLFLNGYDGFPLEIEEGLCCLVEDWWLSLQENQEYSVRRRLLEESEDPTYGGGFRTVKRQSTGRYFPAVAAEWHRRSVR